MSIAQLEQPLSDYEIERGKPMPTLQHSAVQLSLAFQIYPQPGFRIFSELTIGLGGNKYTPDLCIYPFETVDYTEAEPLRTIPPIVCIEIISPSQSTVELLGKAKAYFANGVKSCWIVDPALQAITILQPGEPRRIVDSGIATDPATGLTVDLAKVFV